MNCVFCEIVAGDAPATIHRYEDDTIIFTPLSPVTSGHVLVVPRLHVEHAGANPHVTAATFRAAASWAVDQGIPFNLITSAGRAATQSIDHLHVHYVPRSVGDDLMVPWGTLHGEDPTAPHQCRPLLELQQRYADGTPDAESVARWFHDAYERLAPEHGYSTREASAKPWSEVPANNRALMTATAAEVLRKIGDHR